MLNKELLNTLKQKIEDNTYDEAIDFANEVSATDSNYWSDAISEFADGRVDIYYYDLKNFFNENTDLCEEALREAYAPEDIGQMAIDNGLESLIYKAAEYGEYKQCIDNIYADENNAKKLILINYLLEVETDKDIDDDELAKFIDDIDLEDIYRLDDIKDYADKLLNDGEDEDDE